MARSRLRRIPRTGIHRPHGTSWALARGALHAVAPDPSSPGPVRGLEQEAGFHLHAAHCVAVGTAPLALELLLGALDPAPDSPVLISALAEPWVADAVKRAGCQPRCVDVAPTTLHVDPEALRKAVVPGTVALVAPHTAGVPCDLDRLASLCDDLGLALLEDFSSATGARWRSHPVGALGLAGVAGLDSGRPLSAFGGALIASDDRSLVARLRSLVADLPEPVGLRVASRVARGHLRALRAHPTAYGLIGLVPARWSLRLALPSEARPSRMHPAQAEAARTNLTTLIEHLDSCRERAAQLRFAIPQDAWRQDVPDGALPVWSQLLVRCRDPRACARAAAKAGVQLGVGVLGDLSGGACTHAATAARECIALPCHRNLRERDMDRVVSGLEGWLV